MNTLDNSYDFVYLVDVTNGNPNGDPDAGNKPRVDRMTNHGLITDVCFKRKVRNYVQLVRGEDIYVQEGAVLAELNQQAWKAEVPDEVKAKPDSKHPKAEGGAKRVRQWMCDHYYDVRTFGAVMSIKPNCGQVRGPVQFAFAKSVEPIQPMEIGITRMAAAQGKDDATENRTMGNKHIVPYGLYRMHGFVSAPLAAKTGFGEADLDMLWDALANMFAHDRSAARGEMVPRSLTVFRHDSKYGSAPAHKLFDLVTVHRVVDGQRVQVDDGSRDVRVARSFADYSVNVRSSDVPDGVTVIHKL